MKSVKTKDKITLYALAVLLMLGIFVRAYDLGTHFAHLDGVGPAKTILFYQSIPDSQVDATILQLRPQKPNPVEAVFYGFVSLFDSWEWIRPIRRQFFRMTAVPRMWTYAPFQFLLTYHLISEDQSYREILFWGRLPSFFFGVLGILGIILFYRKYDRLRSPSVLLATALLTFSWQNIIFAKHIAGYAIGVFAAVGILIVLASHLNRSEFSLSRMLLSVFFLAVLSHMQYQVLFLVPTFFLTVFLHYLHHRKKQWPLLLAKFALSGLFYATLITPLYCWYLKQHASAGVNHWNVGPSGEYQFALEEGSALGHRALDAVVFFVRNCFEVLRINFALVPETSPLSSPLSALFAAAFILGVWSFLRTRAVKTRYLGVFLLGVAATWTGLILTKKLAFSPTRHNLILLPFMSIVTAAGWSFGVRMVKPFILKRFARRYGTGLLLVLMLLSFSWYFPSIVSERSDPFDEEKIERVLEQHEVDTLVTMDWTWNPSLMTRIIRKYNYFEDGFMRHPFRDTGPPYYQRVGYLSNRAPLTEESFMEISGHINVCHFQRSGMPIWDFKQQKKDLLFPDHLSDYKIIYAEERPSDVEVNFSKKIKYGSNNFFFYTLKRKSSGPPDAAIPQVPPEEKAPP